MHKALALTLAAVTPVVHARFEDALHQDVPALSEANLLPYVAAGLALWLYLVWAQGWRARAIPLTLCAASLAAQTIWGADGLGFVVLATAFAALMYGAFRRR